MRQVYITAGHSLNQGGASSNGLREELLTIKDKELLLKHLEFQSKYTDIEVISDDDSDSLQTVINKVKKQAEKDDLLLDIHYNSARPKATGVEAFVKKGASETSVRTAKRIVEVFSKMMGIPNRGVKLENQSQHSRLGILHATDHAVLLEVGFITNKEEMEKVEEFRERLWIAVANILIQERMELS